MRSLVSARGKIESPKMPRIGANEAKSDLKMDMDLDRTSARNRPVNGFSLEKMLVRRATNFPWRQLQASQGNSQRLYEQISICPSLTPRQPVSALTSHPWRAVTNPDTRPRRTGGKAKRKLAQRHKANRVTHEEMPFLSIAPKSRPSHNRHAPI